MNKKREADIRSDFEKAMDLFDRVSLAIYRGYACKSWLASDPTARDLFAQALARAPQDLREHLEKEMARR